MQSDPLEQLAKKQETKKSKKRQGLTDTYLNNVAKSKKRQDELKTIKEYDEIESGYRRREER